MRTNLLEDREEKKTRLRRFSRLAQTRARRGNNFFFSHRPTHRAPFQQGLPETSIHSAEANDLDPNPRDFPGKTHGYTGITQMGAYTYPFRQAIVTRSTLPNHSRHASRHVYISTCSRLSTHRHACNSLPRTVPLIHKHRYVCILYGRLYT